MNRIYTPLRPCPVCNNQSGNVLGTLTYALFDDLDIPDTKTLICCHKCGMMYDDVALTEEQLQEYYCRNEHYAVSSLGGSGSLSDDNRNRYNRIIDNLYPDTGGTILDIGCGQGGFVAQCLQRGFRAAGIEPSEKSRNAGRVAGIDIYASIAEYVAKHPKTTISTIVISHVLEHLLEPLEMLKELIRNAPQAMVYIEVPDAASYISPNAMRWYELHFEHLNHFCKDSFSCLAAQSCIEVITAGSTPFSKNQADIQCLFLVGRFRCTAADHPIKNHSMVACLRFTLPPLPDGGLPKDNKPIALWGVSQYAMLLMGSLPQLKHMDRLFDMSSAKIGRKIRGVTVEDPRGISTLSKETRLVLPHSQYSLQMLRELDESASFSGEIVNIQGTKNGK
jgi:SAM-dependent methyltransferase